MSIELKVNDLKPGMVLDKDVFANGMMLLAKGSVIKPSYIAHLAARGIPTITVRAAETKYEDILLNPVQKFYAETYENVGNIIDQLKGNMPIATSHIFPIVERIMETVFVNQDSMLLLTGFQGVYDYHYAHSLDVCIYSLITARALDLTYEEIVTLGMGALLHDVGKTRISDQILFKQGSLTAAEYEEVKKHSQHGYDIVIRIPGIKRNVAQIVLQHHERCDGSGYPGNLCGASINPLAKLVAVADIYDALTSDRVYRKKVLPHEAAEFLLGTSNTLLDPEIVKVFLKNIAIYPTGCQVLLNTNEVAIVHDSNPNMPLRPVLKITTDKKGNPLKTPFTCDLQSKPQLFIINIFN